MLTRLEVDGFKNLIGVTVDFGPLTCIAGPNSVGKSNLFDAIRFLALLADHTLVEAALRVRDGDIETGDLRDLFYRDTQSVARNHEELHFSIAAEMIVDPLVRDDFGRSTEASSTFLRYEVQIGYEPPDQHGALGRLVLLAEHLNYITEGEAASRLRFPHSAQLFRSAVVKNKRRKHSGYISTKQASDGQTEILVHQDGGSRGPGQVAPASSAPRTIVGTSNTSTTPTILAARREMQSWLFLALEPSAMRRSDRFQTPAAITGAGGHIPATLYRLATRAQKAGDDAANIYADIANRLARLVPISSIEVEVDDVRQMLTVVAQERSGVRLPAAALSDGTLRFLTLAVLAADPEAHGLICIEEPENGIHPARMGEMTALLQALAVDPREASGAENPLRQVILATHSPAFVQLQHPDNLLFAQEVKIRGEDGAAVRTLRFRPLNGTWRARQDRAAISLSTIIDYLAAPENAQLKLPDFELDALVEGLG
ncbi:AAA family ATPase [Oscillochloris sp. ZM17-4]|uniref:AAA family ATPase n=1 Tax=Oscillochloris sp. ZM17-4 TaxID=2866714 RepID=UPI001C733901|nr:AAA family ATPase [Oscillochloris sp. ZM17-4]MBX0329992.1 AAA family ATPase [Oscillochloris sp. ZM17-4]